MYKTGAMPGSFGPPAAQPSAVATLLCQEQAVARSASSTPHHLPERLTESQPSSSQPCCCASRKTRSPLTGNAKRQEQKSWQWPRPPADGSTGRSARELSTVASVRLGGSWSATLYVQMGIRDSCFSTGPDSPAHLGIPAVTATLAHFKGACC